MHLVKAELAAYRDLLENIANNFFGHTSMFLRFVATKNYYRERLFYAISQINDNNTIIRREKAWILQEVTRLDKLVPQADDQERMFKLTTEVYGRFRRPSNLLFLILPTSLDQWDPANTANPILRLYFLCNNTSSWNSRPESKTFLAHISNHPGYVLKSPREFLQRYGDHALAVLLMVKYGFFGSDYRIPSLHSLKVLATIKRTIPRHNLTGDNIGPLIDEAIAYIRAFPQLVQSEQLVIDPWVSGHSCSWIAATVERATCVFNGVLTRTRPSGCARMSIP